MLTHSSPNERRRRMAVECNERAEFRRRGVGPGIAVYTFTQTIRSCPKASHAYAHRQFANEHYASMQEFGLGSICF